MTRPGHEVRTPNEGDAARLDVTAWGWVHLILGEPS